MSAEVQSYYELRIAALTAERDSLATALSEARALLEEMQAGEGWRPIEGGTYDGTRVLLYSPEANPERRVWIGLWIEDDESGTSAWVEDDEPDADGQVWIPDDQPTHWMSLPAPPEGIGGSDQNGDQV